MRKKKIRIMLDWTTASQMISQLAEDLYGNNAHVSFPFNGKLGKEAVEVELVIENNFEETLEKMHDDYTDKILDFINKSKEVTK